MTLPKLTFFGIIRKNLNLDSRLKIKVKFPEFANCIVVTEVNILVFRK